MRDRGSKSDVMVNIDYKVNRIYNHHRRKSPGMSVRNYLDCFCLRVKKKLTSMFVYHSMGLNRKEKTNRPQVFISLCFPIGHAMSPADSCSFCPDFGNQSNSKSIELTLPFCLKLLSLGILSEYCHTS